MKRYLITLSSPIAVRSVMDLNGTQHKFTKLVNVVECEVAERPTTHAECTLRIHKWYDSAVQRMVETEVVCVTVKVSNIRSRQEVS